MTTDASKSSETAEPVTAEVRTKRATAFENEVVSFFRKLGLESRGGSDRVKVFSNGNEINIDAIASHDGTLLVIECTSAMELKKKSLRDKMSTFTERAQRVERALKQKDWLNNYDEFRGKKHGAIKFILATKNIKITKEDYAYANSSQPRISILHDKARDYYDDLHSKIGHWAKFELLGEFGVRPEKEANITVPAFFVQINSTEIYQFMINPLDLLEISSVARRERGDERNYQRLITRGRLHQIADYVEKGGFFPNNVIIAFDDDNPGVKEQTRFHPKAPEFRSGEWPSLVKFGFLEFPRVYRCCWVIDGQHRLYSFAQLRKGDSFHFIPVVAFRKLDKTRQRQFFLDINKYQKTVPADYVWDLNGDILPNEEDGIISRVVKQLNETSPIRGRVHIPLLGVRKKKGLLRLTGICTTIKKAGLARKTTKGRIENPFYSENADEIVKNLTKGLSDYLSLIKRLLEDDWKRGEKGFALDNGGFSVLLRFFEKIVDRSVEKGKPKPSTDFYTVYADPLVKILAGYTDSDRLRKLKKELSSEGGRDEFFTGLVRKVRKLAGDTEFGGPIENETLPERWHIETENLFRKFVFVVLYSKHGKEWIQKVPKEVYGKALGYCKKWGTAPELAFSQFNQGQCIEIMRNNSGDFLPFFVGTSTWAFKSENEMEIALDHIQRMRVATKSHDVGVEEKEYDQELLRIYLDKIKNLFAEGMRQVETAFIDKADLREMQKLLTDWESQKRLARS